MPYENQSTPRAQGARFRPSRTGFLGWFRARPGIQNPEFRIANERLSSYILLHTPNLIPRLGRRGCRAAAQPTHHSVHIVMPPLHEQLLGLARGHHILQVHLHTSGSAPGHQALKLQQVFLLRKVWALLRELPEQLRLTASYGQTFLAALDLELVNGRRNEAKIRLATPLLHPLVKVVLREASQHNMHHRQINTHAQADAARLSHLVHLVRGDVIRRNKRRMCSGSTRREQCGQHRGEQLVPMSAGSHCCDEGPA